VSQFFVVFLAHSLSFVVADQFSRVSDGRSRIIPVKGSGVGPKPGLYPGP
jgi:hypothetical protein